MSFKESLNDLVSPQLPDVPSFPRIDFDLTPATLEDDPAMQAVLASLRESSEISKRSLEITESARDIARSSRNVSRISLAVAFVSLIVAFVSFAAAYNLW